MELKYWKEGVECTKNLVPVCCMDDRVCDVDRCRYYLESEPMGNCILRNDEAWTMEDIGKVMGISRQRVEQIQRKALKKMRDKGRATL